MVRQLQCCRPAHLTWLLIAATAVLAGCPGEDGTKDAGGLGDAALPDSTTPADATRPDTFAADTFEPDANEPDANVADAFEPDAVVADAFEPDGFEPDVSEPDAFEPDAFEPDAFEPDAADAGPPPLGTELNPASSCKALLAELPQTIDGLYFIDPDGPVDTSTDAQPVYCDMTTDNGGWTEAHAFVEAEVNLIRGSSGRQMVKCSDTGAEHIISPAFSDTWSWGGLGFRQLGGTWIVNGAPEMCGTDPEYTQLVCPSWWGFGCGNGPGPFNKLFPGALDNIPGSCADTMSAHTNSTFSICGTNNHTAYGVFVRSDDPAPTCTNGQQDGLETDVDCGGPFCAPCAAGSCSACSAAADCADGYCDAYGYCGFSTGQIVIDWVAHCSTTMTYLLNVPNLPAGTYLMTALPSAGSVWATINPPSTGYFYRINCAGIDAAALLALRTPQGAVYATQTQAFAALTATTATTAFAGGTLQCGVFDMPCTDNLGDVRFQMDLLCP